MQQCRDPARCVACSGAHQEDTISSGCTHAEEASQGHPWRASKQGVTGPSHAHRQPRAPLVSPPAPPVCHRGRCVTPRGGGGPVRRHGGAPGRCSDGTGPPPCRARRRGGWRARHRCPTCTHSPASSGSRRVTRRRCPSRWRGHPPFHQNPTHRPASTRAPAGGTPWCTSRHTRPLPGSVRLCTAASERAAARPAHSENRVAQTKLIECVRWCSSGGLCGACAARSGHCMHGNTRMRCMRSGACGAAHPTTARHRWRASISSRHRHRHQTAVEQQLVHGSTPVRKPICCENQSTWCRKRL